MPPFEAVGDRARWRIIYDVLVTKSTDDTVTYAELAEALDLDPLKERSTIQLAMRRAAREYGERDLRAVEAVPNIGYRVVRTAEHIRLAKGQQKRSSKALKRGHSQVTYVDLGGLEPEARKAFEVVAQAFAMQIDFNRRMDVRQKHLETAVESIHERSSRSESEIAELKSRLGRLEGVADAKVQESTEGEL